MKCAGCGHENRDAARFCEECAAPLGRKCAGCGAELRPVARFCDECARPVSGGPQTRSADPRSYTPKHLAEKILTSRSALEGERKQVTVLFADVKGSMELGEKVDPEEWYRIMDRFFQILSDGVHRFEGTVDKFTGDGIMAIFGAPIAHEDHARRACYAALTQEVAYRSQLGERRERVHAEVARAIADLYRDRLDEKAALLAQHWEGVGIPNVGLDRGVTRGTSRAPLGNPGRRASTRA